MANKQELRICSPFQCRDNYSWRSNEDEIYPKDIIYMKPITTSSSYSHSKITFAIEFSSLYAPQRVDIFGGDNNVRDSASTSHHSSHQHSIFHHIKTLYVSPHVSLSSKIYRMKLILELSQNDIHQYYRLLVFPSLTNGNPHRVCELLSVYLLFEESSSTVLPQSPQSDHIGTNFPTPPKSPRRSIKTMFRRNQKIHIGLTPLSSDVLSALFSSQEVESLNQLTPKSVESLITRWIYKFDELQKTKLKSNYSLLDFHFQEIMWTSRHIILFQQYCLDDEIPSKLKKTQRESPFTITSINTLRSRLIQILQLIIDPHYLVYITLPQSIFPLEDFQLQKMFTPLFSQWIQSEMSVQNILQHYYLPTYPVLKSIHFNSPINLIQLPSTKEAHHEPSYSLIQHLFIHLWLETCQSHFYPHGCEDKDICIFQFHTNTIHIMTEETVDEEMLLLNQNDTSVVPDMLFLIHLYRFFPSIQNFISSLSDFRLLFQVDTYHFIPPPPPPTPQVVVPSSSTHDANNPDDDDDSLSDLDEVIEKAISDFLSKDGFDDADNEIESRRKLAAESVPSHETILQHQKQQESNSNSQAIESQNTHSNIQTRKMRAILLILASLPHSIQLSSSHSLDLQLFKVSEAIICSSIIALHHLLKHDPDGKYWFESANYIKRIHSTEYIHGGSVSLQSLDYSIILYSLLLIIPALMIGRIHLLSFCHDDKEKVEKLGHQTLYTLRTIIVYLAEKKHIGVNLISAIIIEILRVCYSILSYPKESIKENYLSSLFYLFSNQEIETKQLLCQHLTVLCFECLCQMLMSFSFDTSIDCNFSIPMIESIVLLFLVPSMDSKIQDAAQRVMRRFRSQFPKYLAELHQRTSEIKNLITEREEQERKERIQREIWEAQENERIKKEKLDREEKEKEERERQKKEEEEAKLQREKEDKYGKMLKDKSKNPSVLTVLEALQKQREEEEHREQELREKRKREIQEEYEREKEKRIKQLKEQQEKEELKRKEKEKEEERRRIAKLEEERSREKEEKEKEQQKEKEKEQKEELTMKEKKSEEEMKENNPIDPPTPLLSNNVSTPSLLVQDETKDEMKEDGNATPLTNYDKENPNSPIDRKNAMNPNLSTPAKPTNEEGKGSSSDENKKADKKKKKQEEVVYEWQERPSKKKSGGGGCLLL